MYKLFLAHKNDFSFTDKKTWNKVHSSPILMRKMLDVCKLELIVEVYHLEKELDTVVIWHMHENNVCLLTTWMMTVLQEIHPKTGKDSYTDQRFITNLFRALKTSPTKKFLAFVDQLKSQWIMEDILEPAEIIQKLTKMHCNMVADGSWLNTNEKDTKIMVLTLAIQEVKKNSGYLTNKVSFDGPTKGGSSGKKGSSKSPNKKGTPKLGAPNGRLPRKVTLLSMRAKNTSGVQSTPPRMAVSMAYICHRLTITTSGQQARPTKQLLSRNTRKKPRSLTDLSLQRK
jgi:hypothetical protein